MNFKKTLEVSFLFLTFVVILGIFVYGILFLFYNLSGKNLYSADLAQGVISAQQNSTDSVPQRNWQIQDPNVQAKAALAVEYNPVISDKVLLNQNDQIRLPIASLTKLMTAVIVLDNYDLSATTTVSATAASQSPVIQDIKQGDTISVENLLDIMLVASSNKSAYALSEIMGEEKFVALMNEKAQQIGLKDTFYAEPTGLSENNYSTTEDLSKLAEYILKNYPKVSTITKLNEVEVPGEGKFENTDEILSQVPEVLVSKTGFTNDADGCLLLVVNNPKNKDYLIYVILGADDRFAAMQNLINWTNTAYTW